MAHRGRVLNPGLLITPLRSFLFPLPSLYLSGSPPWAILPLLLSPRGNRWESFSQWVETRNAEKHPAMHRTTPYNKELTVSNISSAAVEKLHHTCLKYLRWLPKLMMPEELRFCGQLYGWLVTNARTSFLGGPKSLDIM